MFKNLELCICFPVYQDVICVAEPLLYELFVRHTSSSDNPGVLINEVVFAIYVQLPKKFQTSIETGLDNGEKWYTGGQMIDRQNGEK